MTEREFNIVTMCVGTFAFYCTIIIFCLADIAKAIRESNKTNTK